MIKEEVEQYKSKIDKLGEFPTENFYNERDIIDWIANCVIIFTEVGVNNVILSNFLNYFSIRVEKVRMKVMDFMTEKTEFLDVRTIGSFKEEVEEDGFGRKTITGRFIPRQGFYYGKIAFSAARAVLAKKLDEHRLVPRSLVDSLAEKENYNNLISSLESMQASYEDKDADKLATSCVSLLDSILNLDIELAKISKLGGKLRILSDNQLMLNKFGVSKDLVNALNGSRVIRNEKIIHKKNIPIKYDIPFLMVLSFAYLVLFFFETINAAEDLIK